MMRTSRAFTLLEMMVVLALVAIVLMVAAPSFRDFILMQRLKGIHAQLLTDLQLARSEAVARSNIVRMSFSANAALSCYSVYTVPSPTTWQVCDCTSSPACAASGLVEIRTVKVERSRGVVITTPAEQYVDFDFDPVAGGISKIPTDRAGPPLTQFAICTSIDSARFLLTLVGLSGRPTPLSPSDLSLPPGLCP